MKKIGLLAMPLIAVSFLASCDNKKQWYQDNKFIESLTIGDVGLEKEVKVNGLMHKVRLIDVDRDFDKDGNKIHTTWEFANLISDKNGYSLATYWMNTNDIDSSNYDYKNSSVRKALIGEGDVDLNWFRYYGKEEDTEGTGKNRHYVSSNETNYYQKSVLDMLPKALVNKLVPPKKYVNIYNKKLATPAWEEQTITDKLFLLSPKEMGNTLVHPDYEEKLTSTYSYYVDADDTKRIKQQINGLSGARLDGVNGADVDGNFNGEKASFAGNNDETNDKGGISWFRSPYLADKPRGGAWNLGGDGSVGGAYAYCRAFAIAPAFCI